ncbi:MAG: DNA mismatch repair endonuclease MutL [Kiritimatiellae bacterium]|nr:DNA mismatch repair endonuclease MutL [Kiritimatiellia bacterium]
MAERRQIRLLPVSVANKIAAGEVVERPASVLKELLENALDAGATRVEVAVTAGGRKLISVADNGCGMDRDNALMCLEPQATSKIRDVDDIERISTYGFRGEAIPSIAAVSRLTIKTCADGDTVGTCIEVAGGQLQGVAEIGFPTGSTFEVRDLFFNVPARRKFLKSFQTEQTHIRVAFILQALAHPETALRLKVDGRDMFNLAAGATLSERITELFGRDFLSAMRPVDYAVGDIRISGFVGIPTLNRADRGEQYIFVNRRAASAAVIPYALREAYPPLEGDRKPVVVLFVDLPPTEVDVNVHPTKREVRFRDASAVRDAIISAVTKALGIAPKSPVGMTDAGTAPAIPTRVPGSRFPVPGSRFPVPGSRFPVPGSRFPVPGSQFPVPGSQFPVSGSQFPGQPLTTDHLPLATDAAGGDAGSALGASASPPAAQAELPQQESQDSPRAGCRGPGPIADGYIKI